ncbi:MAG TPA: segregation/condensation protein A [archaeon]|nr:segregation/condensation protein A [archaeon]
MAKKQKAVVEENPLEEKDILKIVIEKQSWEEIIYYVVNIQKMDPWNIDLMKLIDGFLDFLRNVKELDFRIPAKVVFVAAILLRLKSNYLSIFEEKKVDEKTQKPMIYEEPPDLLALGIPLKRMPKRQITLEELVAALRKAVSVREKKYIKQANIQKRMQARIQQQEDIEKRLAKLMTDIEETIKNHNVDKVEFKKLVSKWNREDIIYHFIPLLHLEQDQKITTEQEDWFKDIFIKKRAKQEQAQ